MKGEPVDRIELAWRHCRGWITEATGAPVETYLMGANAQALPEALQTLRAQSPDLRLMVISAEAGDQSMPVDPGAAGVTLARLAAGTVGGVDANFTVALEDFDLSIHMIVHPTEAGEMNLELIWWGDEAFPDGSDYRQRFRQIAAYWIGLQALVQAREIYIGPEAVEPPGPRSAGWVKL